MSFFFIWIESALAKNPMATSKTTITNINKIVNHINHSSSPIGPPSSSAYSFKNSLASNTISQS